MVKVGDFFNGFINFLVEFYNQLVDFYNIDYVIPVLNIHITFWGVIIAIGVVGILVSVIISLLT